MHATSLRTQIILPKELRDEIDRQRRFVGESLAEYMRKAARERVEKEKKKKVDLKKLAERVVGAAKGTRTLAQIRAWEREIREERRLSDEHRFRRWDEANGKK